MEHILARKREIKVLDRIYHSEQPEFLGIYGRRRIGKTFLIRQYFKKKGIYFELTGIKNGSLKQQLYHFRIEYTRIFGSLPSSAPSNWLEAFNLLREAIEKCGVPGRIILFFDELPWLATPRSGLLQAMEHFWNRYVSDDHRVILIVCGSSASWMINKVLRNKGGLHGRLTAEIKLLPFDLEETEIFLNSRGIALQKKQLIDIYMAIGGVAKYLTYVGKGESSLQAISQICFEGPLYREFDELYASLFDHFEHHVNIVKALAERSVGLTKNEICEKTNLKSGGGLNKILDELESSGFILPIAGFDTPVKNIRYRLVDEYSLFYLKWISQTKAVAISQIDKDFWIKMGNTPAGRAWAGYAFEGVCLKNISKIKAALGIASVLTRESEWIYKATKNDDDQGVQIDLLIDRADQCINLCEIKYYSGEYVIDKDYALKLQRKKNMFIEKSKTKKSVFTTLITTYGVKKNSFAQEVVDKELTMTDLFGGV